MTAETLERELAESARKLERCSEQFDASERALEATTRKLEEAERTNSAIALETVTLAATLAEARKDAERYRWFRDNARCTFDDVETTWYFFTRSDKGIQEAIDAALEASK